MQEQQNQYLSTLLLGLIATSALAPKPLTSLPVDLHPLVHDLQAKGFTIKIALPPVRTSYGLYQRKSRTIWISPLTFPLGISRPTFLHETVHAIQSCPSGTLTLLGWTVSLNPVVEREISAILYRSYHHGNRALEREAFFIQGQPDAVPRLIQALKQRCPFPDK